LNIQTNISLKPYNTFGLDVKAKQFIDIQSKAELEQALKTYPNTELFILGGGSNMLLTKDVDALVLHINSKGVTVVNEDKNHVVVEVQAGEIWHDFVLWCIKHDYGGAENLSLIPGNVGTSPIQNIGAYGVEIKDVFDSCEAIKIADVSTRTFSKNDCNFGYRNSVFKQALKGQYIITSVRFRLTKINHQIKTDYGAIQSELLNLGITQPTIKDVSEAVINIRQRKLPDPNEIGNSGSFFKNPVIDAQHFETLASQFPKIPSYKISENEYKIPAGWLIDHAGFKGKRFGDAGVHKNQALVLVNYGNAKGSEILMLARLIQKTIKRLFAIDLEAEVNVV
jgi:UDP-N-acetylmuramate dehydrogenase